MSTKEMIKSLVDSNYSDFRKTYKKTMSEERVKNEEIVKKYVYGKISLNKDTMI